MEVNETVEAKFSPILALMDKYTVGFNQLERAANTCKQSNAIRGGSAEMLDKILSARHFVFAERIYRGTVHFNPEDTPSLADEELDLPFKLCSFEIAGNSIAESLFDQDPDKITSTKYLLVEEVSPKKYRALALEDTVKGNYLSTALAIFDNINAPEFMIYTKQLLSQLQNSVLATKKNHGRVRTKNGLVKIKNVVVVVPKKYKKEEAEAKLGKLDWSHKWEVRGHWRACQGVGKDREGVYCVKDFTWVIPHVKGEGELVKKTRVIKTKE